MIPRATERINLEAYPTSAFRTAYRTTAGGAILTAVHIMVGLGVGQRTTPV